MANEISSMMPVKRLGSVKESSQLVKPEKADSSAKAGQASPGRSGSLAPQKVGQEELQEAVSDINEMVQLIQRDLSFSMDDESGRTVVSVIDSGSGDLIRQIPSEEVLTMAKYLKEVSAESTLSREVAQGILFSKHTA